MFNALHDDDGPIPNTRDDIISLANFISDDDKEVIKRKRGRPRKELIFQDKARCPRGRPPKKPITTTMMQAKLLDMVKQYNIDHGIVTEDVNNDIDKLFEPYCVS